MRYAGMGNRQFSRSRHIKETAPGGACSDFGGAPRSHVQPASKTGGDACPGRSSPPIARYSAAFKIKPCLLSQPAMFTAPGLLRALVAPTEKRRGATAGAASSPAAPSRTYK